MPKISLLPEKENPAKTDVLVIYDPLDENTKNKGVKIENAAELIINDHKTEEEPHSIYMLKTQINRFWFGV